MSSDSDTLTAAYMVVLTLGVCFSVLIMGIEGAVGGHVPLAIELTPGLAAVGITFWFASDYWEASSDSEQPEATNL